MLAASFVSLPKVKASEQEPVYAFILEAQDEDAAGIAEDAEIIRGRLGSFLAESAFGVETDADQIRVWIRDDALDLNVSDADWFMHYWISGNTYYALVDLRDVKTVESAMLLRSTYDYTWFSEAFVLENGEIGFRLTENGKHFIEKRSDPGEDRFAFTMESDGQPSYGGEIPPESLGFMRKIDSGSAHSYAVPETVYDAEEDMWIISDMEYIGDYPELTAYALTHPSVQHHYNAHFDRSQLMKTQTELYGKYQTELSDLSTQDVFFTISFFDKKPSDGENLLKEVSSRMDLLERPYSLDLTEEVDYKGETRPEISVLTGLDRMNEWLPNYLFTPAFQTDLRCGQKSIYLTDYNAVFSYEEGTGLKVCLKKGEEIEAFKEDRIFLYLEGIPVFWAQTSDFDPSSGSIAFKETLFQDAAENPDTAWLQKLVSYLFTHESLGIINEVEKRSEEPFGLGCRQEEARILAAAKRVFPKAAASLTYDCFDDYTVELQLKMDILKEFSQETMDAFIDLCLETCGTDSVSGILKVTLKDTTSRENVWIDITPKEDNVTIYAFSLEDYGNNPLEQYVNSFISEDQLEEDDWDDWDDWDDEDWDDWDDDDD